MSFSRRFLLEKLANVGLAPIALPLLQQPEHKVPPVIGVWFVRVEGAPFEPHLFTFHADGTMLSVNPDAGDAHTSDSDGMGPWMMRQHNVIIGAFEEINADRTTHVYISKLRVEFTITLSGNSFIGLAQAIYYNPDETVQSGPYPATLHGSRIQLPEKE